MASTRRSLSKRGFSATAVALRLTHFSSLQVSKRDDGDGVMLLK